MTAEQTARLVAFAKEIIRLSWDAVCDGSDVDAAAERHGLTVPAVYDPDVHGEIEAEPGDEIQVLAAWLK